MCTGTTIRCPHCHNVGACLWPGYGRDWVLCAYCQRRIRWLDVEAQYLIDSEEIWAPGVLGGVDYH